MRIGIDGRFIDDYYPGIGRYTSSLIRAFGTLGLDDHFFVYLTDRQQNSRYDLPSLATPNVHLRRVSTPVRTLREQFAWRRWVAADHLDIVHSPYYVKPFLLGVPSVVTLHDVIGLMDAAYMPSARARMLYSTLTWLTIERSTRVITSSQASRREIVSRFPHAAGKLVVIPDAADRPAKRDNETPVPAGLVPAGPARYLLYVGTNKPHKNLERLLQAYARSQVCVPLLLVGRHDARYPEVRHTIEAHQLDRHVKILGEVDETTLDTLYRGAIATVVPSLAEGFGLPALEAMIRGCPLICSDASSLPEVAGDAAYYFDPRDEQAIVEALRRVVADEELRRTLSARGLERSSSAFSWNSTALQTLDVYRAVVAAA